jgi:hypothetical protein
LAAVVTLVLAACATGGNHATVTKGQYVDVRFPIAKVDGQTTYPHVVDPMGTLWYLDGARVVRQPRPTSFHVLHDANAQSGVIFWYAGFVYVLDGDGKRFTRVGNRLRTRSVRIPAAETPVDGITADALHHDFIAAQTSPHAVAVVDGWRWYEEHLPDDVDPFTAVLAGGPHRKQYLLTADARSSSVVIKDRQKGETVIVDLPNNGCFSGSSSELRVPVDLQGRDARRAWATTGEHIVTLDLETKRILRMWDPGGCAMHIVRATARAAVVLVSAPSDRGYVSSLVKIDEQGTQPLASYGKIPGLGATVSMDRFGRLWWFDRSSNSFICRTPVG